MHCRTMRLAFCSWILACGLPRAARAQARPPEQLAAAESALAVGGRERAVTLAAAYTERNPTDSRGWVLLGRARLSLSDQFPSGQPLQAVFAFRRATQCDASSVEAWSWLGRAGMELGGADGESAARQAWERVLALEPAYDAAWSEWLVLSRAHSERQSMRRALAGHSADPAARLHIARLLIEDEHYDSANVVLEALLRDDPMNPALLALRAQSAYEGGDTATGWTTYARALRNAYHDDSDALWSQVVGIASPAEIRAWEGSIPRAQREGFLWSFWARRNPDLFAGANARIAEHFSRLRVARRQFPLQHALTAYHRSAASRAAELDPSPAEDAFYLRCEAQEWPGAPMRATDRARLPFETVGPVYDALHQPSGQVPGELDLEPGPYAVPLVIPFAHSLRDVDTTAARAGYNLRTGLDDRGLTYLRLGPPAHRAIGAPNVEDAFCRVPDVERWDYPGSGQVRFFRPSSVSLGTVAGMRQTSDMVMRAQNASQFQGMVASLTRDATAVAAPLAFDAWLAEFADHDDQSQTDVAVFATRPRLAAQLVTPFAEPAAPQTDSLGLVVLIVAPGRYVLQAHVQAGDSLGRLERTALVRDFAAGRTLSDVLVVPSWGDTPLDRNAILRRTPQDLTFPTGRTIRVYAEAYGLPRTPEGTVRYRASYQVVRTNDLEGDSRRDSLPGGTTLQFDREQRYAGRTTIEWLDITPELVPPGQYLLRLTLGEPSGVGQIGRAQIAFEIRGR